MVSFDVRVYPEIGTLLCKSENAYVKLAIVGMLLDLYP